MYSREAENIRCNKDLQYATVPSSFYSSQEPNRLQHSTSGRQEDLSSMPSKLQFPNAPKDDISNASAGNTFQHFSPKKSLEANLRNRQRTRMAVDEDNVNRTHFKPIQPAFSINGSHPTREAFKGYHSELEDESRYDSNNIIQYNSDPYLPNSREKHFSNQNFNPPSPRNNKLEHSTMKRVRLAIPHYSEPDLNSASNPQYKVFYEGPGDDSSFQLPSNENDRNDVRSRIESSSLQFEMSPRRRPTGFGGRLLAQVPEQTAMELEIDDSGLSRSSPISDRRKYNLGPDFESRNKGDFDNFEHDDNSENRMPPNSSPNPPTYLKRRRTAVFGLSPTSGLNIGAVM